MWRAPLGLTACDVRELSETALTFAPPFAWQLWQMLLHPLGVDLMFWVSATHFSIVPNCPDLEAYLRTFGVNSRASLMRQLNYWGFGTAGPHGPLSNPHFQLLVPVAMLRLKRSSNHGMGSRAVRRLLPSCSSDSMDWDDVVPPHAEWTDPEVRRLVAQQLASCTLEFEAPRDCARSSG
tara:strand:+ start:125 stop:661 length:537 start_codon:yes stop_codon:yes gene_type:complete